MKTARHVTFYLALFLLNLFRYLQWLSDDDQWSLWKATMIRLGDLPFRDFVIVGDPLDMTLSWLFQSLLGASAFQEYLLAALVLTIGTALFAVAARHLVELNRFSTALLYSGLFLSATRIDIHSTPKHVVLGLCALTLSKIFTEHKRAIGLSLFCCAVAFLYRHDFLFVVLPPICLALSLTRSSLSPVAKVLSGSAAVVVGYLLIVALFAGGVTEYIRDYVSIGLAKSAQSSPNFFEPFRTTTDSYPAFKKSVKTLLSSLIDQEGSVTIETKQPSEVVRLWKEGAPKSLRVLVPAEKNLAREIPELFVSSDFIHLKGLAAPLPGKYILEEGQSLSIQMEEGQKTKWSFEEMPPTEVALHPAVLRVDGVTVATDIRATEKSWAARVSAAPLEIGLSPEISPERFLKVASKLPGTYLVSFPAPGKSLSFTQRLQRLRQGLAIVPGPWLHVWAWGATAATFALAFLLQGRARGALLCLSLLQTLMLVVLVRWGNNVPPFASLPLVTAVLAFGYSKKRAHSFLIFLWFLFCGPMILGKAEVLEVFLHPGQILRQVRNANREARFIPRSRLTANHGGYGYLEDYLHRCTKPTDRIFVVGDKMSIPYSSQRRIYRSTNWHEGVLSSPSSQEKVARELVTSANLPVFVSEIPGGPLAGLSKHHVLRPLIRGRFEGWTLNNDAILAPRQHFWMGFAKNYPFRGRDPVTGWPCASPQSP